MHSLEQLEREVSACRACALCQSRTNTVFGVGVPGARVMFVGEAPGANEDKQGQPFVGRAGELLDRLLLGAGFSRSENIYIANILKCRPPENRDPTPQETAACISFLHRQIAAINPEYIVCLGRIAAGVLISPDFKVTAQHGKFYEKDGRQYMGTFHPAALLRNPNHKPATFDDLCKLRDILAKGGG